MPFRVTFIGAGNVAWHLSKAFENAGYGVAEVYSRTLRHARLLADRLYDTRATDNLNLFDSSATLFLLCVPDDAHDEVLRQLVLPEHAILVHTSGSRALRDLQELTAMYSDVPVQTGVFYPLQTFSRQVSVRMENVPLCIEAFNPTTEAQLVRIAQDISQIVYLVSSEERQVLHLAAVFACNFTNHLWALAHDLLDEHQLDFDLLKPLITETVQKAIAAAHPRDVQTGPAVRGDVSLMNQHRTFLRSRTALANIYQLLSNSIRQKV
jgi:predicted short-subunit dehydrogenase-like oxidoreductase (DUF2520 family)